MLSAPRDTVLPVSAGTSAFRKAQVTGLIDEQPGAERPNGWAACVGGWVRPLHMVYVVVWLYVALVAAIIASAAAPVDLWMRFALPSGVLLLIIAGHLAFRASVRVWRWRAHEAAHVWAERLGVRLYGSRDEGCADQPVSQRILYPHEVREREVKRISAERRQLMREGVTASLDELSSEAFQGQVSPEVRQRLASLSTRIKQVA